MIGCGLTVAVVDDDLSVRRGLERLLRSAGYRAETFSSAREFLARAGSWRPGCLLLDVSMPGQTGMHLHEELVASGQDIPVIFITGHGDAAMAARAMEAGAAGFLSKPFDDEALLRAIEQATSKSNLRPRTS
jgi:FixJ family two-component response regulator